MSASFDTWRLIKQKIEADMARVDFNSITLWIAAAAVDHPHDLPHIVAERAGVSRTTAHKVIKRLAEGQWLARSGSNRGTTYQPGLLRQVVQRYALDGLSEDIPWARDFSRYFNLPENLQRIVQHAFSELLSNAIDHSGGRQVTVSLRQTPSHVQLLVSDDGRGLFNKVQEAFSLEDPQLAMLELSKGKLTSQPERHTGRGLFFTSKLADVFDLHANELAFQYRGWDDKAWSPGRALKRQGTSIYAAFCLESPLTLDAVLRAHSLSGQGLHFERTVVPLRLMVSTNAGLESRAQARRVASRLNLFRRAEVDFSGVTQVGHSFADELFRVMTNQMPELDLVPINMNSAVAEMVGSIRT